MLVSKKVLSESINGMDDVMRALRSISDEVDELLSLQRIHQRQVASLTLTVNLPSVKNSPAVPKGTTESVKIQGIEKLRKNYAVVRDLWSTQESLEAMETRIHQAFAGQGTDTSKALAELAKLKKKVQLGLNEAFAFLASLAEKHLPSKFAAFNSAVFSVLEKSIVYSKVSNYTYVFEIDGELCYSTYVRMEQVQDDDGTYYPELYVVTSYLLGASMTESFIGLLTKFAPPSEKLLQKKVSSVKETLRALHILLSMDNFATAIGSIPISTLLKTPTIDRSLFLYQQYIKAIEIREKTVVFTLKPEIQDKAMVDKISNQINLDFKGMVHRTNANMNMRVHKAEKCWIVTFITTTQNGALWANEDDLSFLKERFQLSDMKMRELVRTINSGSPL